MSQQLPILAENSTRPHLRGACSECSLKCKVVRGYGSGGGIAIIGESPGPREVLRGRPFIGQSGQLLNETLKALGVNYEEECYYTNSVLCHSRTKPDRQAIQACNDRLREVELPLVAPRKILGVGAAAAQALTNPSRSVSITKMRGRSFYTTVGHEKVFTICTWHPAAVLRFPDYFRDFIADIRKLLERSAPDTEELETIICWKPAEAISALKLILEQTTKVSCDIETSGFSIRQDILLSIGFGLLYPDGHRGLAYIFPANLLKNDDVKALVLKILNEHQVVFHNQKFDLKFLARDLVSRFRNPQISDTLLLHYTLDERSAGDGGLGGRAGAKMSVHGLKDLARFYCDADDYAYIKEFLAKEDRTREDFEKLFYYQGQDCYYTIRIDDTLTKRLSDDPSFRGNHLLFSLLNPAARALSEIEAHGMLVDQEYLNAFAQEKADAAQLVLRRLSSQVRKLTGLEEFNPNSSIQVAQLIYDFWKYPRQVDAYNRKNLRPTTKEVLLRLAEAASDPVAEGILRDIADWREQSKLFRTYAAGLLRAIDDDGRVRTNFSIHGTVTGRLSSSSFNAQNLPNHIGPAVEWAFIAPPDYQFVVADFSQIEIRVLAYLSQDEQLAGIFKRNEDIHMATAQKLFGKREISDLERQLTKTVVFGVIYGRGPDSILRGKEMQHMIEQGYDAWTWQQAKDFQQEFLHTYPNMRKWLVAMAEQALKDHYVETPTGRRRRFPLILADNRAEVLRQAGNAPIQGTASDICLNALVQLHDALGDRGFIINTVHDSLLMEIKEEGLEETLLMVKEIMEQRLPFTTDIPFPVKFKVGDRWGNLAERKV